MLNLLGENVFHLFLSSQDDSAPQSVWSPLLHFYQALQCCDEGAYLLANQQMDKCQSKEGAQKALQDVEKFLESSSPYLNFDPQTLHYDFESILTSELKVTPPPVHFKKCFLMLIK